MLTCSSLPEGHCLLWREGLQADAIRGGAEADGTPLLIATMQHEGGVHPGKAGSHLDKGGSCGCGGKEVQKEAFQTLVVAPLGTNGVPATIEGDMTRPCARPLNSMAELGEWQAGADLFNQCHIPLVGEPQRSRRGVLVCHDMQGGYGPGDRYPQGGTTENVYTFDHWDLCDVFVYFSHHRVTIPPASWVNAAHRHGVPILGTFITEWDKGAAECVALLSSLDRCLWYGEKLVEVALYYGFDGWLINIENCVTPDLVPHLVAFCEHLTRRMHEENLRSKVIWYDSLTFPEGVLKWQNRLSPLNQPFFDVTDGIFVNYAWEKEHPALSAALAKDRRHDVFVGIDVFGRGTYGGGKWACPTALDVIKEADCSVALFGPAWTFESEGRCDRRCFEQADARFWEVWRRCDFTEPKPTVRSLPFETSFNKGCGACQFVDGTLLSALPWCDIAASNNPPSPEQLAASPPGSAVCEVTSEKPYTGGSSLCLTGSLGSNDFAVFRLLSASVVVPPSLEMVLAVASEAPWAFRVAAVLQRGSESAVALLHPSEEVDDSVQCFPFLHLNPLTASHQDPWTRLSYRLDSPEDNWRLLSLLGICGDAAAFFHAQSGAPRSSPSSDPMQGRVFVGEIRLCPAPVTSPTDIPTIDTITLSDLSRNAHNTPNTVSITMSWRCINTAAYCNVCLNGMYQGRAYCNQYRLCDVPVDACLDVQLQVVLTNGTKLSMADVPRVHLEL
eukprot:GGOE01018775.1.p1 GENE.GGOE01018775.1~~GGOE01018775.1.p1  ORF type:complete len:728 (-),score=136.24 GGOE01018775.1:200-2383(-)